MRIVSKFQDYYDTAMAFGQDLTSTYLRRYEVLDAVPEHLKFITGNDVDHPTINYFHQHSTLPQFRSTLKSFQFDAFIIVFCGKIHRGIRIIHHRPVKGIDPELNSKPGPLRGFHTQLHHFYSMAAVDDYMRSMQQDEFFVQIKVTQYSAWRLYKSPRYAIEKFFTDAIVEDIAVSIEYKLPIISWDLPVEYIGNMILRSQYGRVPRHVMSLNVKLKDYEFYKVFDACTAYQELDMFISGMIAPENKPMVVIEDKHKVVQHGFDCHSFKKDPTKRKPKICKKPS